MTSQTHTRQESERHMTEQTEQTEQDQALAQINQQMREQTGYWAEGLEDDAMKKAFALGAMMGIKLSADRVRPGQTVVRLPRYWQSQCDRLSV